MYSCYCTLGNRYLVGDCTIKAMAETSPGDNDDYEGPATNTDSSPDSQPSSLHTNDGSFEKTITSHPLAEMFQCVKG